MTRNPKYCLPSDTVQVAAIIMRQEDCGIVPVLENKDSKKLVGVVTDRDLCIIVISDGRDPMAVKVDECMTDEIISCRPDDNVDEVIEKMQAKQVRRIPVVDASNNLIGIISMSDLVRRDTVEPQKIFRLISRISEPMEKARTHTSGA